MRKCKSYYSNLVYNQIKKNKTKQNKYNSWNIRALWSCLSLCKKYFKKAKRKNSKEFILYTSIAKTKKLSTCILQIKVAIKKCISGMKICKRLFIKFWMQLKG